jgi:hypothetical protein
MKGQAVVLKEWVCSPRSRRVYPPGLLAMRLDQDHPFYDDGYAVIEVDYTKGGSWRHFEDIEVSKSALELL